MTTGTTKLISASGNTQFVQNPDPLLSILFRHAFWVVGVLELILAAVGFFSRRVGLQACLVAWLATSFVIYRPGLIWVGHHQPCSGLGHLTDALHIPPRTADTAMKIILAYLLIGWYATLFWLWTQHKKATPASAPAQLLFCRRQRHPSSF
jgi:hypothetical protein